MMHRQEGHSNSNHGKEKWGTLGNAVSLELVDGIEHDENLHSAERIQQMRIVIVIASESS